MAKPRPSAIAIASAVVACEVRSGDSGGLERVVMAKLSDGLGKLVGASGFDVVLARAVILAQKDNPALANVSAAPGGVLSGFSTKPGDVDRDLIAVLSHLFELLIRFIGEALARRVVREIWPDVTGAEAPEDPTT